MDIELWPEEQYADWRQVSLRTIQRERARREGPAFIKLVKRIFYRTSAVEAWVLAQEIIQPRAKSNAK